ncbi:MAG: hypothetical protein NTW10_01285 [Bacteroidetes bacterium]|nr:hypothetical protein [Bacteroidota bacterium]
MTELIDSSELFSSFMELLPSELIRRLEGVYSKEQETHPGEEIDFLQYLLDIMDVHKESGFLLDSRKQLIIDWIEEKKKELRAESKGRGDQIEKIIWNCNPSVFGYLFLELIKKGYIKPPVYNGDTNFTKFSRLCMEHFEIKTTPENLKKALHENSNQLSDTKRAKFFIPELSDLG